VSGSGVSWTYANLNLDPDLFTFPTIYCQYGNIVDFSHTSLIHFCLTMRHSMVLTLLVGWQEGHLDCKETEWWDVGVVIWVKVLICIWPS